MTNLTMWAVYERPSDFPRHYVARQWIGESPTLLMMMHEELEPIQAAISEMGFVRMERHANDDPRILEVWI